MTYDVQIGSTIRRGISYAELIVLPIDSDTFVRRNNDNWIRAKKCIELSHILAQDSMMHGNNTSQISQNNIDDYAPDGYAERGIGEMVEEERIFIPSAEYFKCKQNRKAAIIGVCTLGLAGLSLMGIGNTWRSNIFAGTSLSANAGISFVLKCLSFCFLTALIAIPYFIYSLFALIYYSIRLNNLKR